MPSFGGGQDEGSDGVRGRAGTDAEHRANPVAETMPGQKDSIDAHVGGDGLLLAFDCVFPLILVLLIGCRVAIELNCIELGWFCICSGIGHILGIVLSVLYVSRVSLSNFKNI